MQAGFANTDITPPLGTPLAGCGSSTTRCAERIHDPLMIRAAWLRHGGLDVVIASFDWCFMGREDADRFKGVLARHFGLLPRQILLACTHTHAGPAIGTYDDQEYTPPLRDYLRYVEASLVNALRRARSAMQAVRVRVATGKSSIPVNRRLWRDGRIENAPNLNGPVIDSLPVCLLETERGEPVVLLFSVAAHPVAVRGPEVSADFPGLTASALDLHVGRPCSIFLQGAAGDLRPRDLVLGNDWLWESSVENARRTAMTLADEVTTVMRGRMRVVRPELRCALFDLAWPLQRELPEVLHRKLIDIHSSEEKLSLLDRWLERQKRLQLSGADAPLETSILLHGLRLGDGVQLVALEGEPVAELGRTIEDAFGNNTFALGYANGQGLYLVTTQMLAEGGYEVESFWEYGVAAPLAHGGERMLNTTLDQLRESLAGDRLPDVVVNTSVRKGVTSIL